MTEAKWLACEEPMPMLEFLRGKASDRKLRLFAVACCRCVWEWLPEYSRKAVEIAECYADKRATRAEMSQARKDVTIDSIVAQKSDCAMACGEYSATWGVWEAVTGVVRTAPLAPSTPEYLRVVNAKRKTRAMHEAARRAGEQRRLAQCRTYCHILRDIFSPFRPIWVNVAVLTSTVIQLAQQMYESRDFSAMPIFADALQDAGCDNDDILSHCRDTKQVHVRGCWVVDLVLNKE